jgi:hypothetical protein
MKDITLPPMIFIGLMFLVLLLGMLGMWGIGKLFPGTLGVTTMRDRIANRLSEMRYRREQEMRRR